MGAVAAQLQAQRDQVVQGAGVDVAGDDRGDRRVAGDGAGGVAVQLGAAVAAAAPGFPGAARRHRTRISVTHPVSSGDPSSIARSSAKETCAQT